jgi:hypothetical protein
MPTEPTRLLRAVNDDALVDPDDDTMARLLAATAHAILALASATADAAHRLNPDPAGADVNPGDQK